MRDLPLGQRAEHLLVSLAPDEGGQVEVVVDVGTDYSKLLQTLSLPEPHHRDELKYRNGLCDFWDEAGLPPCPQTPYRPVDLL